MYPFLLKIGSFKVPAYGFMLAVGILLGIHLAKKRAPKDGLDPNRIDSMAFWVVIASVLGSRLLYTFGEHGDYYFKHPLEFFSVQKGGLAFSGSLIAAVATLLVLCRKWKVSFWKVADVMTPPVALGLVFGKLGCFLAGCCYGKVCELAWGVSFNHPDTLAHPTGTPLHPVQIYEALAWLALFFLLLQFRKKDRAPGEVFFLFGVGYGVVRFLLEYLRGDPGMMGPLTTAQATSVPLVLLSVLLWVVQRKRNQA